MMTEILKMVDMLCKRKINAKNLFKACNEYALSLLSYYLGTMNFEPEEFERINNEIRMVLINNKNL